MHLPCFFFRTIYTTSRTTKTATAQISTISAAPNARADVTSEPKVYTTNAAAYATAHCMTATTAAFQPELNSRFMDAIAATQGVYSRTNVRNANAESGVNSEPSAPASSDVETPSRTPGAYSPPIPSP